MRFLLVLAVCLIGQICHAVSFLTFDAKTMGTSGAGSITAFGHPQPHTNPSTWSPSNSSMAFSLYWAARLTDRENFIETLEALERKEEELKLEDQLRNVKRALRNGSIDAESLRGLAASANIVRTEIDTLPNKPLRVGSGEGLFFLVSNPAWTTGVWINRYQILGAVVENEPSDLTTIERLGETTLGIANILDDVDLIEDRIKAINWPEIDDLLHESWDAKVLAPELVDYRQYPGVPELEVALEQLADNIRALDKHITLEDLIYTIIAANEDGLPANYELGDENLEDYLRYPLPSELSTRVVYSGADVMEAGWNFSMPIEALPGLSVGANVKHVVFSTVAFVQKIDDFDLDQYSEPGTRLDYEFWNMDLGLQYLQGNGLHWGLAIKGVRHKRLDTLQDNSIALSPLVRAGVAYQTPQYKVAFDADLTKNEPLGFDPDKRYLSVGGEWFFVPGQSLRMGYRYNAVDNTGLPSIGLGFSASKLTMDLAVSYDERSREAAAGVQLGLQL